MTVRQRRKRRHEGPVYELKDLTVHEVSLVDRPAIGREILITKSVGDEEDEMAKRTAPENPKPEDELEKKGAEGVEGAEPPNGAEGEPPVEKNEEPSTLTVQGAVEFLREHSEEISSLARYAVGVLERHLGDEEPADLEKAASFDEAYRRMAAPGQVWAACDALSSVIWDVLYDEGEEGKLDAVDKTVDDFKSTLRGILTDAGVKAADAVATDAAKENGMRKVKIGDREIEVSGSDEVMAFFEGLAALTEGLATLSGRIAELESLEAERGGEEAARKGEEAESGSDGEGLTGPQIVELIRDQIEEARKARHFRSAGVAEEDANPDDVARREAAPVAKDRAGGSVVSPGLAGLKRVT